MTPCQVVKNFQQLFPESNRNGIADLATGGHYSALKHKCIGKGLKPRRLANGNAVMLGGMHKPPLGRVDTRRGHRRRRLIGIDSTVYVAVSIVIFVAVEHTA